MSLIEIRTRRARTSGPGLTVVDLPPAKADLTLSGQRDASELRVTFDRAEGIDLADLAQTVEAVYGRVGATKRPLYRWGAGHAQVALDQGRRTIEATLDIGPYRYAQETRRASAWLLYDELISNAGGASDLSRRIIDSITVVTGMDREGNTQFDWNASSETARWVYMLNNNSLEAVMAAERGNRGYVQSLVERIYVYLAGMRVYDDAVRVLYEHFGLLTFVDYSYSNALGTIGPSPPSATAMAYGRTPPPLHFQSVYDPVPATAPSYTSKTFRHGLDLGIRPEEPVLVQFKYDAEGDTLPAALNLVPNADYWLRYKSRALLSDVIDDPFAASVSDQARQVQGIVEHVRAAWFEGHITQRQIFMPNRTCEATLRAPATAAEVIALTPGNAVMIDGRGYWITEMSLSGDTEIMRLALVDPSVVTNDTHAAWLNAIARL